LALNLGINHLVPWICERGLQFLHRRRPHLHRVKPIDAPFRKRIEIRYLWGSEVDVALRVQLDPAVKRRTLQVDESFEQAIHGTSFVLSRHRAGHTRAPSATWRTLPTPGRMYPGFYRDRRALAFEFRSS